MRKRKIAAIALGIILVGGGAAAYVASPTVHAGQSGEAPEFGRLGAYNIGTSVKKFALADRTKITTWGAISGNLTDADRELSVRFWYPAKTSDSKTAKYAHIMRPPGKDPVTVSANGVAVPDATALVDEKYPLVLMSHGFGGWDTQFSNLAEQIASHGYIVASINHADMPIDGIRSFLLSFGNVLVDRSLDQRQILMQILADAQSGSQPYAAQIDTDNVGLIGYSMGGYGAIASAGAFYDFANDPMANIPAAARTAMEEASQKPLPVKSLVTFAPWGGQPDSRAWTADSIAAIDKPVLVISGNQDDVVNYEQGVKWLFENMTGSNRYMLVYREARHNIVGNEFDLDADSDFTTAEFLKEPVWRSDRLNAINQHFVTAFLDMTLKGDASKADYLNVPTVDSNDSKWPIGFGEQLNGKTAGDEQSDHWKGFQRRWAVGLEMHHMKKKQ
ncbi:alpha/beta hydrolase family protein [Parasphingorhabdus cellanae]|uniref:Prolyl oligopeptidase family serine peptidase n=1 Tax=Parasphingorhabdus cellanae TaxID=2806553 RepID=A0ABX7T7H3_9SPHN|nr:prolyl oligopeptidase family serine peptidase [Parasphingorhabdus cellanae]QTD56810.1 prolyl oligopeptidase family serine peptidase [Parasphingorhabdus cellanae]